MTTAIILLAVGALILLWSGLRTIFRGRKTTYYRIRAQRVAGGWRAVVIAIIMGAISIGLLTRGESTVYRYFPPSPTLSRTPTLTLTPTISLTPSITLSPTITLTPAVSNTPTLPPTPFIPDEIATLFVSVVTPFSGVVISPMEISQEMSNAQAVDPRTRFDNPVGHLYAAFSYDQMVPGVQWTAIWYRDGKIVFYETKPWDGTTGGYGYTDWDPVASEWLSGEYRVAIFVGMEYLVDATFTVSGEAPTSPATATETITQTPALPRSTPLVAPSTPTPIK